MNKLSTQLTVLALAAALCSSPVMAATVTTTTTTEKKAATTGAMQQAETEVTTTTKIEYELPYPGILPDHPLYFLKQIRDWILDKLIVDSVKKAEFYMLQADKRLNSGMMLIDKGSDVLGEQVISKGEKYMNNALTLLLSLKAEGRDVPAHIVDRLEKAVAKHRELLEARVASASEATKTGLTASLEFIKNIQEQLVGLKQ